MSLRFWLRWRVKIINLLFDSEWKRLIRHINVIYKIWVSRFFEFLRWYTWSYLKQLLLRNMIFLNHLFFLNSFLFSNRHFQTYVWLNWNISLDFLNIFFFIEIDWFLMKNILRIYWGRIVMFFHIFDFHLFLFYLLKCYICAFDMDQTFKLWVSLVK